MTNWPERMWRKCRIDKSLAIALGLKHLYIEPEAMPKGLAVARRRAREGFCGS